MQFLLLIYNHVVNIMHICQKSKIIKYLFFTLFSLVGIIAILINLSPTFNIDEAFTMGLIKHNFISLINLDGLDVHPPLYYLLLKLFLLITTFWTKSMFIQVLFARLFSLLISMLFIIYLIKLLKECSFRISYKLQGAVIIACPVFISRVVSLRMYILSLLFLTIEQYFIFKFFNRKNFKYLYAAAIFTVLNLYTFYIAGLSAILYLCMPLIREIITKNHHDLLNYIKPVILSIILYIPWLPVLFKQYINHISNDSTIHLNSLWGILMSLSQTWDKRHVIILLTFYIIMIIYAYGCISNKSFITLLSITLINMLVTTIISLIICGHNFQANALYPSTILGLSIIMAIMIYVLQNSNKLIFIGIALLLSLFLLKYTSQSLINTFHQYKPQSMQLVLNMNNWKKNHNKDIYIQPHNYIGISGKAFDSAQDAVYLKSINKNAIIKGETYKNLSNGILNDKNNEKLCKDVFTNMKTYKSHK